MIIKSTVTAFAALVMFSLPVVAQEATSVENSSALDDAGNQVAAASGEDRAARLLTELSQAETDVQAQRLERRLVDEWSKSGSPAMDLLLKRGRDALAIKDYVAASEHFRALTDHAPDFAEGWHGLALTYYQSKHYGPAMDALEHVLTLNPDHFGALRGVGAINDQVGKAGLAYEAYSRVLKLRPHDADVIEAMERLEIQARGRLL